MVSSRSQWWYMYLVLMALPTVSINTATELQVPELTVILDFTHPVVDDITWPIEEVINFFIKLIDTTLDCLCLPFHYVSKFLHISIDFIPSIPVMIISQLINILGLIIKFLLEFLRKTIITLIETVVCFPVDFFVTKVTFLVHGLDLRPQLAYFVVSATISVVNFLQGTMNLLFDVVSYIVVDLTLCGLLQSLLELPVWTLYIVVRFLVVLFEACIEITCSFSVMLIHRILVIICSLLQLVCFLITYAVIFICHCSLDIFLLIMTAIIGLTAWLAFAVILLLIYVLVCIFRRQDNILTITQKVINIYDRIRNPQIELVLEVFFDLFPKEIWSGIKSYLRKLSVPEKEDDENICKVCYDSSHLVKLIPCGHRNTCKDCIEEIIRISNRCPMCRSHIHVVRLLSNRKKNQKINKKTQM